MTGWSSPGAAPDEYGTGPQSASGQPSHGGAQPSYGGAQPSYGYGQPTAQPGGYPSATPSYGTSATGGVDYAHQNPAGGWGPSTSLTPPPYGAPGYGATPGYGAPGSIGQVRSTGFCILLAIVTLGFYSWFWYFKVHEEMKRHTGTGLGGPIALVLAVFVGIISPYLTSDEVGDLYKRRGQAAPVSGLTGLWVFPGIFILIGPIIWFVKTNAALNDYWRSLGATG